MSGFSKLFSTIIASSIWSEDDGTVRVWITLLALKDARGVVDGSVPGLARLANVNREACERALAKFLAPDLDSRDLKLHPEREGRRIEEVPGGWRILNHEHYRDMQVERDYSMSPDAIKKRRQRGHTGTLSDDVPPVYASASASVDESVNGEQTKDSLHPRSGKIDEINRPGVKALGAFMAAHNFGRWNDTVEGYIRASRVPLAIMSELELWIAGELNRRKTDPETLGEALNAYAAATPGDPRFQTNYFGGFVRGVHRNRERNEGNRRNSAEARTIIQEERDAETRRQEEADRAMLVAFEREKPDRFAELKTAAEAKVDREMPKARKNTPQMWAMMVNDELIRTVREESR